jgi:hypothetical protein
MEGEPKQELSPEARALVSIARDLGTIARTMDKPGGYVLKMLGLDPKETGSHEPQEG